jgi:hypothetical protein
VAAAVLALHACHARPTPIPTDSFSGAVVQALREVPFDSLVRCSTIEVAPQVFRHAQHTVPPDLTVFRALTFDPGDSILVGTFSIVFVAPDTSPHRQDRTHADFSLFERPSATSVTLMMMFGNCNVWEIALLRLDSTRTGWRGSYVRSLEP